MIKKEKYIFKISYLNISIKTHTETKHFDTNSQAYDYFLDLIEKFNASPYYYLCEWY